MPIKKIQVSFELDIDAFIHMLAHSSSNVRFEAFGTDKTPKSPTIPKIRHTSGKSAKQLLLDYLVVQKDKGITVKELAGYLESQGFATGTSSSQIAILKSKGLIKSLKPGVVQATSKAINSVGVVNGQQ